MKIVVLDGHTMNPGDNPWTPLQALGETVIYERTAPEQVVSRSREAGILVVNKVELTRDVLAQLPLLRMIAVTATGYNVVDVAAAR
ncbi:MAG: D-2-hydroxyacid dehydrogenase, partial [Lentisphaerae bacterium]|nr:D-2-hydroxyacid dehydrogenase [Lentisphaerota bacterium]